MRSVCKISLSFRLSFSLSDMTNYKSAFGKVCRIKNRHTFKSMPILNSAYFTECRRHIVIPCGKVCRIKNRHTFKVCRIKNQHTFKSMPILNSSYHAVKYAELRIGILLKVCRFVIRHITQTQTQTETELLRRHMRSSPLCSRPISVSSLFTKGGALIHIYDTKSQFSPHCREKLRTTAAFRSRNSSNNLWTEINSYFR